MTNTLCVIYVFSWTRKLVTAFILGRRGYVVTMESLTFSRSVVPVTVCLVIAVSPRSEDFVLKPNASGWTDGRTDWSLFCPRRDGKTRSATWALRYVGRVGLRESPDGCVANGPCGVRQTASCGAGLAVASPERGERRRAKWPLRRRVDQQRKLGVESSNPHPFLNTRCNYLLSSHLFISLPAFLLPPAPVCLVPRFRVYRLVSGV